MSAATELREVKEFVRQPYTWPGAYPLAMATRDGGVLCKCCARKEFRQIVDDSLRDMDSGWRFSHLFVNWEDSELFCAHCENTIESAYGESV